MDCSVITGGSSTLTLRLGTETQMASIHSLIHQPSAAVAAAFSWGRENIWVKALDGSPVHVSICGFGESTSVVL